jgi:hypothetical protein
MPHAVGLRCRPLDHAEGACPTISVILEYDCLVRVKTSITLPEELLSRLDRLDDNRSALLERAALAYLARLERQHRDQRDIEIINRHAKRLNREALDTLEYQRLP